MWDSDVCGYEAVMCVGMRQSCVWVWDSPGCGAVRCECGAVPCGYGAVRCGCGQSHV